MAEIAHVIATAGVPLADVAVRAAVQSQRGKRAARKNAFYFLHHIDTAAPPLTPVVRGTRTPTSVISGSCQYPSVPLGATQLRVGDLRLVGDE